jgi:protein disulfide-isomerase A6
MRTFVVAAVLFLAAAVVIVRGDGSMYDESDGVIALDKDNFAKLVFGTEHVWVVEFYAPWCGHCRALKPEYAKLARTMQGVVRIAAVNCDEQQELCGGMGVKGFPTIKLFPSDRTEKTLAGGKRGLVKTPVDYEGPRSAASIASQAAAMLPNFAEQLSDGADADAWLARDPQVPKVLLFTDKTSTATLYKSLAIDFHHRLAMGEVRKTQKALVDRYEITKFPTLVVIPPEGKKPVKYEGPIQYEPLIKFLLPFATERSNTADADTEANAPEDPEEWSLARITSKANWDQRCLRKRGVCVVAVLDPFNAPQDEIAAQEGLLRELAAKYKGKLHVMWLGAAEQPAFVKAFDLRSGFPALVAVNPARGPSSSSKDRYTRFIGAFAVDSLSNFLDALLTGRKGALEPQGPITIADINPDDFLPPPPSATTEDEEDLVKTKPTATTTTADQKEL